MMRRRLALLLLLALLPGCEGRPASEAPAVAAASRAHAGETITYFGDSRPPAMRLEQQLIERFTADTGIEVTHVPRPIDPTVAYFAYRRALRERPEAVDVLLIDLIWPPALARDLADLGTAMETAGYWGPAVAHDRVDGRLVALPFTLDFGVLYYRRDLLAAHGFDHPPRTWKELERMALAIQAAERGRTPGFYGFVWSGAASESLTCAAIEWQVSHGGEPLLDRRTGALSVSTPAAIAAFRQAASWPGRISPPGVSRYSEQDALEVFQAGRAAFLRGWISDRPALLEAHGAPIGLAPLPRDQRIASTLGGWHLAVSAHSRRPEAARMFMRYMLQPEVQTWLAARYVIVPATLALHDDPALSAVRPFLSEVRALLPHAVVRPSIQLGTRYPAVSRAYTETVNGILQGSDPVFATELLLEELAPTVEPAVP